jgi:hypothetical protein
MLSWLSRAALDIIGLAGFGYDFDSLASEGSHGEGAEQNELLSAFQTMFGAVTQNSLVHALTVLFPILRSLVSFSLQSFSRILMLTCGFISRQHETSSLRRLWPP